MEDIPVSVPSMPSTTVKRLYFIRHGETASNALGVLQGSGTNSSLNERGEEQARYLRDFLATVKADLVVTSELIRTQETARIVLEKQVLHPPLIAVPDLREISWGSMEGTNTADVHGLVQSWNTGDFDASSPMGESPLQVESRAIPEIYALLKSRPEKNIFFILHGRLLRIIMSSLLYHDLSHMASFTHHNTCINVIDAFIGDEALVDGLNADECDMHPPHISFKSIRLDIRDHLPPDMQGR